jgi:hypothetical protein
MSSRSLMGLEQLTAIEFPDVEHAYGPRDTILYALGIGFGIDPLDSDQLAFVYEPGLRAMPTMATVLAAPGFWYRDRAIDIRHEAVVHASERIELAAPLPAAGALVARTRVVSVIDKGAAKGVLIVTERKIRERATDRLLATVQQTAFCRADGGRGGTHATSPAPHIVPGRPPDAVCTLPTQPQGALDPARAGHLRRHRSRAGAQPVRLRPRPLARHRLPVHRAGVPRRCHPHRDVAGWLDDQLPGLRGRSHGRRQRMGHTVRRFNRRLRMTRGLFRERLCPDVVW